MIRVIDDLSTIEDVYRIIFLGIQVICYQLPIRGVVIDTIVSCNEYRQICIFVIL